MKKQQKEVRKRMIVVRLNDGEYELVEKLRNKSTERNLSSYLRKVALQKPVIVKYRNGSADDFLKQMLELRRELNGIGINFNQAVHKLHLLDKIPEFRTWLHQYDTVQKAVACKVEEIRLRMVQLYEQWLQK